MKKIFRFLMKTLEFFFPKESFLSLGDIEPKPLPPKVIPYGTVMCWKDGKLVPYEQGLEPYGILLESVSEPEDKRYFVNWDMVKRSSEE